jgi:hypothetical protein
VSIVHFLAYYGTIVGFQGQGEIYNLKLRDLGFVIPSLKQLYCHTFPFQILDLRNLLPSSLKLSLIFTM